MKKQIKSVVTLVVICAVISILMALTNYVTKPIIDAKAAAAANEALSEVLPGGTGFTKVNEDDYTGIPSSVTEIYAAQNGGYAITLVVNGYGSGMKIMVGIDANGEVVGAKCLDKGGETKGEEATYGEKTLGTTLDTIDAVDIVAGTTKTTTAYKNAVKAALQAAAIMGGASLDTRTPEEILRDNLNAALPTAEWFDKVFLVEVLDGVSAVYESTNSVGKVYVVGESFIAVGTNGISLNGTESEKQVAEAAHAKLVSSTMNQVDLTSYGTDGPFRAYGNGVEEVYLTATGNYVMKLRGAGFGRLNDDEYIPSSNEYIYIKVSLTSDGTIIDCITISQAESDGVGSICGEPSYYEQYAGKTESTYTQVDAISGATFTTNGYRGALQQAFAALELLKGGD